MKPWHGAILLLAAVFAAAAFYRCGASQSPASTTLPDSVTGAAPAEPDSATSAAQEALGRVEVAVEPAFDLERDLHGIVVDTAGIPIPGVALTAWLQVDRQIAGLSEYLHTIEGVAAETTSDTAGRFRINLEPRVVYDLVAIKNGLARRRLNNLYAGENLRVVMARSASISGRITSADDGSTIAGVEVMARQGTTGTRGDERLYAISGADGAFSLANLPPNFYSLQFAVAGYARSEGPELTIAEGEQARADVTLERGTTLHGKVTDGETHLPIAGAEVGMRMGHHPARTDAEGRYLLTGIPVGYQDSVFIRAEGYGKFDFPLRDVPPKGLEQDFGLLRGRVARGRVVNREGMPIPSAEIVAESYVYQVSNEQNDRRTARTDLDGRFTLNDLRVDHRHTLLVHGANYAVEVFDFPASEWETHEIELGDIVLERPCTLAGVVVDTNDDPQPDLWVSLSGEPWKRDALGPSGADGEGYMARGGLGFDKVLAKTDGRGRFSFASLPTGQYHLSAGKKGYARRAEQDIELIYEDDHVADLKLVIDLGLSISGIVVNRDGQPIPGASVSALRPEENWRMVTYNITQPDGRFNLIGLDSGPYLLHAEGRSSDQHYGESRAEGVLGGATELRLVLPNTVQVSGVVVGPDDEPVQSAIVQIWSDEYTNNACDSNKDGSFSLWVADDQNVTLLAIPPFNRSSVSQIDASLTVTVGNVVPGTKDLVIRLPRLQ